MLFQAYTAKILAAETAVFYSTSISHLLFNGHIGRFLLQQFILHQWPVWDSKQSCLQLKPAKWAGHKTVATTINTNQYDYQMAGGKLTYYKNLPFLLFQWLQFVEISFGTYELVKITYLTQNFDTVRIIEMVSGRV